MKDILLNILYKETESLRLQFISKTEEYAKKYYDICIVRSKWFEVEWCVYFGINPRRVNVATPGEFLSYPDGFYGTKNYKTQKRLQSDIHRILNLGLDRYITKEIQNAENHYKSSIDKLADRILKKDLDISKLQVLTSHIGININTMLTDGNKTVNAYTIIAEGEIQQPHYRYLVK